MIKKSTILFFAIFSLALFQDSIAQSFSGSYDIGGSAGADYATISAAITDLKTGTVTGNVTFQLEAGTYHETIDLSSLNNGTFSLTLEGSGSASTFIHPTDSIPADSSGISIRNSHHLTLRNFTLIMEDISKSRVDYLSNRTKGVGISGSTDITLENLTFSNSNFVLSEGIFEYVSTGLSLVDVQDVIVSSCALSGAGVLIALLDFENVLIENCDFEEGQFHIRNLQEANTSADRLHIKGNTFNGPFPTSRQSSAIYLFGHSPNFVSSSFSSNLIVENNIINGGAASFSDNSYGMYINIQNQPIIRNNTINDGCNGVFIGGAAVNAFFESNRILRTINTALHIQNCDASEVVNNVIASSYLAVSGAFTSNMRLAHNTFSGGGNQSCVSIFGGGGAHLIIINNIFSASKTAINELNLDFITANDMTLDHNLYSGNASVNTINTNMLGGRFGSSFAAASLSDWQTNQGLYDQNSQSFQPIFVSSDDYHVVNDNYRFGTFLNDVTYDIDGDSRNEAAGIDVGADQSTVVVSAPTITSFTPASGPVGVALTISGTGFDTGLSGNIVLIDGIESSVTSATSTQLDVIVPAGVSVGRVTVLTNSLIAESLENFQVTFESERTLTDESFKSDLIMATGAESVLSLSGDLDMDGENDVVIANATDQTISVYRNRSSGTGDINFDVKQDFGIAGRPGEMALADFNGDGKLDLAIGYTDNTAISIFRNTSSVGINFDSRQDFNVANNNTFGIASGDLDGDGKLDIVFVDNQSDEVVVLKNGSTLGAISFTTMASYATGDSPVYVTIADMDQDQFPDVIVANQTDMNLSVLVNDGAMNLSAKSDFAIGGEPTQVLSADIDGDHITDLISISNVTLSNPNGRSTVLRNSSSPGSLSFSATNLSLVGHRGTIGDYNGDGKLDIASIHVFNGLSFIKNTSAPANISFESEKIVGTDVQPLGVSSSDLDHDGEPDILISGVSISFNNEVEVLRNLSASTDILSFSVSEESSPAILDSDNHTINLGLTDCSDIKRLTPSFNTSFGASAYLLTSATDSVLQASGVSENDYGDPFTYTLVAEDGVTAQDWMVSITGARYSNYAETEMSVCESYEWHGTVYTLSGTYQELFTNSVGCDSTEVLHLNILEATQSMDHVNACESYEWNGTNYTQSGTYQELFTNSVGCDSTATLNLTILEPTFGDEAVEVCESYEWEGTLYTVSGSYQEILTNSAGCDSTATLNLTILEPTSGDEAVEVCESYEWEGTLYTVSGSYQEILTNSAGCDSTATLNLTILEPTSGDEAIEVCESYEWEGTLYTVSGSYQEILTNSAGCDSTATLNLTILEPTSGDEAIEVCESYEWEGTLYTVSGSYQEILTNSAGCDSTATLNLTILEPTSGDEAIEVCESYEWEGTLYTVSRSYQEILTNSAGCDSTATLNLTILEPTSGDEAVEVCESYEWEGTLYTVSGSYQEILTNSAGCDSTATLNLTILEPTSGDEAVEVCESYEWEGTLYTVSGSYQEILTNSAGCDSTATLNLTILEPTSGDEAVEVCESYEWEGTLYTVSGSYQEILTNSAGCDSTATLNLTILEPTSGDEAVEVCESYEWEGTLYTVSGSYQEILTNSAGCDSTATLNLTILEPTSGDEAVEVCESYEWEGTLYTTSGTYQELLTNSAGCDSTATLTLTILESTFSYTEMEACESYEWNGRTLTENGIHEIMLSNEVGCDSLAILDLTLHESTQGETEVIACGSYEWEGTIYEESGFFETILNTANGCDSIATLNLTISQAELNEVIMDVCADYSFGTQQITSSGIYQETFSNSLGCDSTVLLRAEVFSTPLTGIAQEGATLIAEDNSAGMTYQWLDCSTNQRLEGETNREFLPDAEGDYSLEISNGVCITETTCFSYIRDENVLNTADLKGSTVSVYPNPTSEKIHVSFPKDGRSDIAIYGLDGRLIVAADVSGQNMFVYELPEPGMYLLQVNSSSGQQEFIKVLRK